MAEIRDGGGIKPIAFYLPQFHAIPENDRAWGEGFTEWTNIKKAQPLFEGHEQPRVPLGGNYYNLLDDETKIWQANLAKAHGVFGFCYYHYWFGHGRMLLQAPAEQMLKNPAVDLPFCFSWANEPWSKRWDGGQQEVIMAQDYGDERDWLAHLDYLLPFFRDARYITLDGKPVFLIYKPEEIPRLQEMIACWQREIKKYGFPGLCLMIQNPVWFLRPDYNKEGFAYQVQFQPFFALGTRAVGVQRREAIHRLHHTLAVIGLAPVFDRLYAALRSRRHRPQGEAQQTRLDYDEIWSHILDTPSSPDRIECAFTDWDNTPRKKTGYMHLGASPDKFETYMTRLLQKIRKSGQPPLVFINAWNEWCEGAYLEPDECHGYAYIEALKRSLERVGQEG